MEIKTVTYQCPNCSAALEYNNALGKFKCLFCDSEFTEEDIKKRFAENEGFELSQENLEAEQEAILLALLLEQGNLVADVFETSEHLD